MIYEIIDGVLINYMIYLYLSTLQEITNTFLNVYVKDF